MRKWLGRHAFETLESLELVGLEVLAVSANNVSQHAIGSLREFKKLKTLEIPAAALIASFSNEDRIIKDAVIDYTKPERPLITILPASLEKLIISPSVPFGDRAWHVNYQKMFEGLFTGIGRRTNNALPRIKDIGFRYTDALTEEKQAELINAGINVWTTPFAMTLLDEIPDFYSSTI